MHDIEDARWHSSFSVDLPTGHLACKAAQPSATSAIRRAVSGVSSEGFKMTLKKGSMRGEEARSELNLLPHAKAGADFQSLRAEKL